MPHLIPKYINTTEQHTGYYPYGEPWREPSGQPWLYGGKERMHDGGLNEYELPQFFALARTAPRTGFHLAGARQSCPTIAKNFDELAKARFSARRLNSALCLWTTPDPLAQEFSNINPLVYCAANPIKFIDPSGKGHYAWDKAGLLYSGTARVITKTTYNWNGQPHRVTFEDGGYLSYTYRGDGTLRALSPQAMVVSPPTVVSFAPYRRGEGAAGHVGRVCGEKNSPPRSGEGYAGMGNRGALFFFVDGKAVEGADCSYLFVEVFVNFWGALR